MKFFIRSVIPLKDITNVQRIESNWMMKKELHYFEVFII